MSALQLLIQSRLNDVKNPGGERGAFPELSHGFASKLQEVRFFFINSEVV